MKVEIEKKSLAAALSTVGRAVLGKPSMPILGTVRLVVVDGQLQLTCTNLDLGLLTVVKCLDGSIPGGVCVDCRKLTQIVSAMPMPRVTLATKGSRLQITSGSSRFELYTLSVDEFPPVADAPTDMEVLYKAPQAELLTRLEAVDCAMSNDETRFILNGVYLDIKEKTTKTVATDGRRMNVHSLDKGSGSARGIIVPAFTVSALCALLGDEGNVAMYATERKLVFEIDSADGPIFLSSKIVEGSYPNYGQVTKNLDHPSITLKSDMFVEALKRVSLACGEKSASVTMRVSGKTITLLARDSDLGECEEQIDLEQPAPAESRVAFNPRFLIESIRSVQAETFSIGIKDDVSPIVVRGNNVLSVVMPVRIS
ncbi:MAG: DNA polymerase III subunit beta [Opitutaceae bacterium]|nr:DNA polymerase III subunit beta [Opitutaceae bacterium]